MTAKGSQPPTFSQYKVDRRCYGCGRKLTATETLWFTGGKKPGVFGLECFAKAAKW